MFSRQYEQKTKCATEGKTWIFPASDTCWKNWPSQHGGSLSLGKICVCAQTLRMLCPSAGAAFPPCSLVLCDGLSQVGLAPEVLLWEVYGS